MANEFVDQNGKSLIGDDQECGVIIIDNESTRIEKDFPEVQQRFSETDNVRKTLETKLLDSITKADLDLSKGSPRTNEVLIQAMNALSGLQKDRDTQAVTVEKLRLSKKANDDNVNYAKAVTELLRTYRPSEGGPSSKSNISDPVVGTVIENIMEKRCEPFTAGELDQEEI